MNSLQFLKKFKEFKSIKSDNEYWLDRPQQTVLSRLILERSSDWSCDWSCNITVMNTCSLVWAVSHTNVVSNTASPEELAAVLQLPFIIAQQSIQIHDFYIKIHSSSFWDMHQDVLSHVCHMYSCHVSPAMFVCPAIPAIVISTMRLTMALSLLSIDSSSCSNSCSNRFKLMLSIVPIEVHALTSVFRH